MGFHKKIMLASSKMLRSDIDSAIPKNVAIVNTARYLQGTYQVPSSNKYGYLLNIYKP